MGKIDAGKRQKANTQNPGIMSTTPGHQQPKLDRYVVIHVATTCDEHGVYVTKDSAEVIEIGWILLDAQKCEEVSEQDCFRKRQLICGCQIARDSVLVKPVNTPITPLCSKCSWNGRRRTRKS